ncbi:unnamed protein product [Rhodiola kirilowii]
MLFHYCERVEHAWEQLQWQSSCSFKPSRKAPTRKGAQEEQQASQSNDNGDAIIEQSRQGDNLSNSFADQYLEGVAAARTAAAGYANQDDGPARQRLLAVANRLPVSAVRRGDESWTLEMSAGGLVSALLAAYAWHHIRSFGTRRADLIEAMKQSREC